MSGEEYGPSGQLLRGATLSDDFMDIDFEPVKFAIEPIAPRQEVTLLSGHGGTGKSAVALSWCAHVAAGRDWCGLSVMPGNAVYISLEDQLSRTLERLQTIVTKFGLPLDIMRQRLSLYDVPSGKTELAVSSDDKASVSALAQTMLYNEICTKAENARLVVIDNSSDAFGGNENDRIETRTFMRMLSRIARDNDASVVLLSHVDKVAARGGGQGNSYSGSTAWHNSARSRVALLADGETGVVTLSHEKSNYGPRIDDKKFVFEGMVIVPHDHSDDDAKAANDLMASEDAAEIVDFMRKAHDAGDNINSTRRGNSTALQLLRNYGLPSRYNARQGKERFWRAVDHLLEQGTITTEDYRKDYKDRTRFILQD